ncbi:MAG: cytochrome c biogenesis protein CcsA [Acidimicrobiales bacterium]
MTALFGSRPDRSDTAPVHTGSRATRVLGWMTLVGVGVLLLFAFVLSPEDARVSPVDPGSVIGQSDAVRLMYIHVPSAIIAYVAFSITAVGSVMVLWKRSRWWDHVAHASAEIGVVFCGLTLVTGSIWGRPTWNTWWEWGDVRLVTTLILFLMYLGYLALRSVPADPDVQARRAAIVALVAAIDIPIVNRSVEWWENRTLHQQSTLTDLKIEDLTLFTLVLGFAVFGLLFAWLLVHRFRTAWLQGEVERHGLSEALVERRAEADADVDAAVRIGGGDQR